MENTQEVASTQSAPSNFEKGDIIKLVRVRFPGHASSYPFLIGDRKMPYGEKVMALSDRGMALGYINSFVYEEKFHKGMLPLRHISKVASEDDIEKELHNYKEQKRAENLCKDLIEEHKLDMNLTHVEFTEHGKKCVFYFIAPARVDFRALVKDLVGHLQLKIELRQISLRDRAAAMGSLGPCGRELCCSSFLSKYGNVSIKMAKNQNLSINYSKLNGACGQLKCCLQYEDEVYSEKRQHIPLEGSFVKVKTGDKGRVYRVNILAEQFDLFTDQGKIKRYVAEEFDSYLESDFKMPRQFDHVSDETGTVIGLNQLNTSIEKFKQNDSIKRENEAIEYATQIYGNYFDEQISTKDPVAGYDADLTVSRTKIKHPHRAASNKGGNKKGEHGGNNPRNKSRKKSSD